MSPSRPRPSHWLVVPVVLLLAMSAACSSSSRKAADAPASRTAGASGSAAPKDTTPIKIGGSFPFSGPFAQFANTSAGAAAYFASVNAEGGVDGRMIKYSAADDGYDPSRLAANARKAVEQDKVAALISFGGPNVAIQKYMNEQQTPQIVLAGNTEFSQPQKFPYSHAWWPDVTWEAQIETTYVLNNPKTFPNPVFGLISLNNSLADSHIKGIATALGSKADALFPEANRVRVEPSLVDYTAQLNQLRAAGVNVLVMNSGTTGMINAMKYVKQVGWNPSVIIYSVSSGRKAVLQPAGLDVTKGTYSAYWLKDPADPRWANHTGTKKYLEVMAKYGGKDADAQQYLTANGYGAAQALVTALKSINGPITGDAINKAWLEIRDKPNDVLVPGAQMAAGPGGRLVYQYQPVQFDGTSWQDLTPLADAQKLGYAK